MGKPAFRTNPKTGRLEKLINGKYVPQNEMGAWKKGSPIRKFGRLLIREPSPELLAEAKRIRDKKDQEKTAKEESDRKKKVWTTGKPITNEYGKYPVNRSKLKQRWTEPKKNPVTGETYGTQPSSSFPSKEEAEKNTSISKTNEKSKGESKKSTVFTKHYKTGKQLGVMTRNQRRAYDKEADGKTWEGTKAAKTKAKTLEKKKKLEIKQNKNKGSGRDGSFGKGTHGKGLPSNPQLKTQKKKKKLLLQKLSDSFN